MREEDFLFPASIRPGSSLGEDSPVGSVCLLQCSRALPSTDSTLLPGTSSFSLSSVSCGSENVGAVLKGQQWSAPAVDGGDSLSFAGLSLLCGLFRVITAAGVTGDGACAVLVCWLQHCACRLLLRCGNNEGLKDQSVHACALARISIGSLTCSLSTSQ